MRPGWVIYVLWKEIFRVQSNNLVNPNLWVCRRLRGYGLREVWVFKRKSKMGLALPDRTGAPGRENRANKAR